MQYNKHTKIPDMKKIIIAASLIAASMAGLATAQNNPISQVKSTKKILVTYFSVPETSGVDASSGASRIVIDNKLYGNTEYVADVISKETGGDLFRINTQHKYADSNHRELVDYAKKEAETKSYPKIAAEIKNFAEYDVVFVGYPNWWYDMPMVIYTLFNDYDFSGKTIIPFCTHGGSGFSQSVKTIGKLEKDAKVVSMPAIPSKNIEKSTGAIKKWIADQGLNK